MPWKDYILLANKATQKANAEIGTPGMRGGFAPVADGINIPKGKFYADPDGVSSDVPMLLCTTFHEWGAARTNPEMEAITAVAIALLTIYDMCKAVEKEMVIGEIRLVEKTKENLTI